MTPNGAQTHARRGDWIEAHGLPGCSSRRGQIIEILGSAGHERFRVRWDEQNESICYPADGVVVLRSDHARSRRRRP